MSEVEITGFLPRYTADQQEQGRQELRKNLGSFAYDALVQLEADLREGTVKRGTWDGCVLSYRLGEAGSTNQDVEGAGGNRFTIMWDTKWMTFPEVLREVQTELVRRVPTWTPADVPAPVDEEAPAPVARG